MWDKSQVSLNVLRDQYGRIVSAPVLWIVDMGPGRIAANSIDMPEWDKWAQEMYLMGILVMPLLPNSTAVTALMDKLYGPFKAATRVTTQMIYAEKLQQHAAKLKEIKATMARENHEATKKEKKMLQSTPRLMQEDIGRIVFGNLDPETREAAPDSPFALHFTPEKIRKGAEAVSLFMLCILLSLVSFLTIICHWKLGYMPFNPQKLLEHPKVRQEVGQDEETEELREMMAVEARYNELKERCRVEGLF